MIDGKITDLGWTLCISLELGFFLVNMVLGFFSRSFSLISLFVNLLSKLHSNLWCWFFYCARNWSRMTNCCRAWIMWFLLPLIKYFYNLDYNSPNLLYELLGHPSSSRLKQMVSNLVKITLNWVMSVPKQSLKMCCFSFINYPFRCMGNRLCLFLVFDIWMYRKQVVSINFT